jgi:hypothetical protein
LEPAPVPSEECATNLIRKKKLFQMDIMFDGIGMEMDTAAVVQENFWVKKESAVKNVVDFGLPVVLFTFCDYFLHGNLVVPCLMGQLIES